METRTLASTLRRQVSGRVVTPAEPDYDDVRSIWNGMIERKPTLIVQCLDVLDVQSALAFGIEHGLEVAVRGGGHNVSGNALSDGGLVIDLSMLREVTVDPATRRATAQPGVRLGGLDAATLAHGLAVPVGIATETGLAGLTLGGGIGWLMRRWGLTCDALTAAEVVTAAGRVLQVSAAEHPDLFWGLRGGGGNFGIVTRFEYRAERMAPHVYCGLTLHPAERAEDVLRAYRDFAADEPEEVTTIVSLRTAPPAAWVPSALRGRPVVVLIALHCGPPAEAAVILRPLRAIGEPLADTFAIRPFLEHQAFFDATVPAGHSYYWRSEYLPQLDDDLIAAIVAHAWRKRSPLSYALLFHMGGAIRRVREDDTSFAGRGAEYAININGAWADTADKVGDTEWVRWFHDAIRPLGTGRVYVNFMMDEGGERARQAYGPAKYARLSELKARWDPDNVFRLNQNIIPAPGGPRRNERRKR